MTQLLSTGKVPGLRDGEWEEVWDCSGGGVLNGEFEDFFEDIFAQWWVWQFFVISVKFHKIFLLNGEFDNKF